MAKRLYDTLKFEDPWYRKLSPINKLFMDYILCKCDIAGFWKVDIERASWEIGAEIIESDSLAVFNGRIELFDGGSIWFVKKFVLFQQNINSYKDLSPTNNCHLGIMRLFKKRGLIKSIRPKNDPKEPLTRGLEGGTSKSKSNGKSSKDNKRMLMLFEELWQKYPRKIGKSEAERKFLKTVLKEEDLIGIKTALKNFLSSRQAKGDPQYVPHGSTWFGKWQDWITYIEPLTEKERSDEVRESLGLSPRAT